MRRKFEVVNRDYVTPCWIWKKPQKDGYGPHRAYYIRYVGPVPEGLELDHLCFQKACVNPLHLEPVTHLVNIQRAVQRRYEVEKEILNAIFKKKQFNKTSHCKTSQGSNQVHQRTASRAKCFRLG